jgi:hypothetical protein
MKSTFRPERSNNNLLVTLFVAVSALIMIHGFLLCAESNEESGYSQCNMCVENTRAVDEQDLHFSSTGFTVANQLGKIENMDRSFCSTQESEKVIRPSIIDKERIFVLSLTQTWFIHSRYRLRLPPFWHPSIPIAHRKLII